MGKKVLAAKSGRAACPNVAAGGGIGAKNAKDVKSFLTGFTGLREASVKPAETKSSGVAWIGDIPEGWEVCFLSQKVSQVRNRNYGLKEKNLLSLSYGKIKRKSIEAIGGLLPASFEGYNVIAADDIVLRLTDLQNDQHSLRVGLSHEQGIVTSAYTTIRPNAETNAMYLYYLLFAFDIVKGFYGMGSGVRQGLNYDEVKRIAIVVPPLPVQRAIAAYLDEKCGAIDAAVAEAKKGIEEYKAWKKSLIDDIVCNGIDRHRHRKETGEVWLADIPIEWDFIQIRYLFALRDERNDKPLKDVNLISLYTDKGVVQHADLEKTTGNKASTADGYKLVYESDIVVNIILCWMGAVGRSAYNGVTSPAYDVYRPIDPTKVLSRYYHYLFRTPRFNGKCYEEGRGIMMMRWRTYSSEFRAIKVPVPPLEEQRAIAAYLDEKCAAIDAMIAEKEALIADLEAYKKSLIYEVVTGKREVASTIEVK